MKKTVDITDEERVIVLDILNKHVPGCTIWVFGSRVTGSADAMSDLDLVIECKEKLPIPLVGTIREDFAESSLPMRVDVLDWHRVSPEFRGVIDAHKVLLTDSR